MVRLGAEIQDLEGVLADVADKVVELEEAERTAVGGKHDIAAMIGQVLSSPRFKIYQNACLRKYFQNLAMGARQ